MYDRRQRLIEVFEDTQKFYTEDPTLASSVAASRDGTKLYAADEYPALEGTSDREGTVSVTKRKTIEAAMEWHSAHPEDRITVLNFASATRPGGGVKQAAARRKKACAGALLFTRRLTGGGCGRNTTIQIEPRTIT